MAAGSVDNGAIRLRGVDQQSGGRTDRMTHARTVAAGCLLASLIAATTAAQDAIPAMAELLAHKVALKPELVGTHPRVFVTSAGLEALRQRARTTHRAEWSKATARLRALSGAPPPAP